MDRHNQRLCYRVFQLISKHIMDTCEPQTKSLQRQHQVKEERLIFHNEPVKPSFAQCLLFGKSEDRKLDVGVEMIRIVVMLGVLFDPPGPAYPESTEGHRWTA